MLCHTNTPGAGAGDLITGIRKQVREGKLRRNRIEHLGGPARVGQPGWAVDLFLHKTPRGGVTAAVPLYRYFQESNVMANNKMMIIGIVNRTSGLLGDCRTSLGSVISYTLLHKAHLFVKVFTPL